MNARQWVFDASAILIAVIVAECLVEYLKACGVFARVASHAGQ